MFKTILGLKIAIVNIISKSNIVFINNHTIKIDKI